MATVAARTFHLGALAFTIVDDGTLHVPVSLYFKTFAPVEPGAEQGAAAVRVTWPTSGPRRVVEVPEALWRPEVAHELVDDGWLPGSMNCLLVRSEGKLILVDTGMGTKEVTRRSMNARGQADAGSLLQNLAAIGVQPADVDIVILTHAHADHIGWATVEQDGRYVPTFPRATYWMTRREWEVYAAPAMLERYAVLRAHLGPLLEAGQAAMADGETAITSEVSLWPSPGHTAGHACVLLHSQGHYAMHVGDAIHHPVEFKHLDWLLAIDYDGPQTIASRRRLIDWALAHDALLIAAHTRFPGTGRLRRQGDGAVWEEAERGEPGRAP